MHLSCSALGIGLTHSSLMVALICKLSGLIRVVKGLGAGGTEPERPRQDRGGAHDLSRYEDRHQAD